MRGWERRTCQRWLLGFNLCTEWLRLSFPVTLEKYQFLADRMGHDFSTGHDVGGASGKEPACRCRRHEICGFDPWIRTIPWRREQQPTPVFLPGESHGQRSLAGYGPEGRKESDRMKWLSTHTHWFQRARVWLTPRMWHIWHNVPLRHLRRRLRVSLDIMPESEHGYQKWAPPSSRSQQSQTCRQPLKIFWRTLWSRISPIMGEKLPKKLSKGEIGLGRVPDPQITLHLYPFHLCPNR